MKAIKYIFGISLIFCLQACFQDLKEPAFDYPESKPDPTMEHDNPEKLKLTFDTGYLEDEGDYQFQVAVVGNGSIVNDAGVSGHAYQGADKSYLLINPHEAIHDEMTDVLSHLKEFSLAVWLKTPKTTGATGIFSIANSETFWSNFEVFFENNDNGSEAFIKTHLYNDTEELWAEVRLPDFFTDSWHHIAVTFNASHSSYRFWYDGEVVLEQELNSVKDRLTFNNLSSIVVGATQFQTIPSLTNAADNQDWASYYKGLLDGLHFYTKELSQNEINQLIANKE